MCPRNVHVYRASEFRSDGQTALEEVYRGFYQIEGTEHAEASILSEHTDPAKPEQTHQDESARPSAHNQRSASLSVSLSMLLAG